MNIYPDLLKTLIEYFRKLPGIGEKTAERYALALIDLEEDDLENFAKSISQIKKELRTCEVCGHLTDKKKCYICDDETRNQNLICVVEDYKSVFMNINSLVKRVDKLKDAELILALKPNIEGDTTTLYIKKILEDKNIKITRLSNGIPMGAEIEYIDILTLERALSDRKEIV